MIDQRVEKLAQVLVKLSLKVQAGEKVVIKLAGVDGLPLARAAYEQIILAGALPHLQVSDEQMEEFFFTHANKKQLTSEPKLALLEAQFFDKSLQIIAESNVNNLTNIESEKILIRSRLSKNVREIIMSKPWVLTYFPTPALAQAAGMSLRELENYIFAACDQDWLAMSKQMKKLIAKLDNQDLHLVGKKTDLTLSTKNQTWIGDDWQSNMPGGEVFTSPVKESVNGKIYFDYPLSRHGKTISGIELEFKNGIVVKAKAATNEKFLLALLQTDAGAKFVGEIALGLNLGCHRYLDNVLYDEKMAGTIHLALGAGFPECGVYNQSALHLDMVKNMKLAGSQLWAGDKLILADGKLK
ncbi:MAG: aminopeptidase [bacterium]|nr:aminopeptidase [bacterium]